MNDRLTPSTIPAALATAVTRFAANPWMAFRGEQLTFADLKDEVDLILRGLRWIGVAHRERVGLFLDNRFEWLQTEYAVTSLGAWLVPLNTWFRSRELDYVLRQSGLQVLIWTDRVRGHDSLPLLLDLVPELGEGPPGSWSSERFPALRTVVGIGDGPWPPGVLSWEEMLQAGSAVSEADAQTARAAVSADDVALLLYTSGTTGHPKGAMIRHRSVVDHIGDWAEHLQLRADDRSIMSSPLFWSFGCTVNALVPLHRGSMIVLQERFEASAFLRDLLDYECTHLQGVPSQYEMALNHPDSARYDLSGLRLVQIGGSASAEGLARRLLERAPKARMVSSYGLTEATGVNTYTELDDPPERITGTVGHAARDTEIVLRSPNGDEPVPIGEVGELCIRSASVMLGYLDNPDATESALRGGWLHTGDLAVSDEHGYLTIVGRSIDAYKRGGMNVYPAEAEAVLSEHPSVQAAAIIGAPDDRLGEVGLAVIVAEDGATVNADELLTYCAERIAAYKVPERVIVVDELPVTPTGKIQKFAIRQRLNIAGRATSV
jgi:fatty-acyl-CoA synthase